jgi:cytochrome c-type biogenesis protein CcmE
VKKQSKFGIAAALILGTLGWLAMLGVSESKTYYHTVKELATLEGSAAKHRIRVGGDVRAGSIKRLPGRVDFVLEAEGQSLNVSYVGRDPLPDTFIDGSQALVEGRKMPDGNFVAEQVQAKCASKYEAAPGQKKPGEGKTEQRTASPASGKS